MSKAFEHLVEHISNGSDPDQGIESFAVGVKGIIDAALIDTHEDDKGVVTMHKASLKLLSDLSTDLDGCAKAIAAAIAAKPDLGKLTMGAKR